MDSEVVKEYIREEVPDWDDEVMKKARFKAFSGQRTDWEPRFQFWRDLILKISRHFGIFIIQPSLVKNVWFNQGGLTPLCIEYVLFLMYDEGDIMRFGDLDRGNGRLSQLARKMRNLMIGSSMTPEKLLEDRLIVTPLLKDKATEVIEQLSNSHWDSSCVVTMKKLQNMCGGLDEASAVLSYLSGCGKAKYLSVFKREVIEGVKVCLSAAGVSTISSLDYDVLHMTWTFEKLQQQIHVIDQCYERNRKMALAHVRDGKKTLALRYVRESKQASESKEKCVTMLNRVEEVLNFIADSESTKKVAEALKSGAQAMRESKINVDEVDMCMEELEESIQSQKEVERTLELAQHLEIEDEDMEEEFCKLELQLEGEVVGGHRGSKDASQLQEAWEPDESLANVFSRMNLAQTPAVERSDNDNGETSRKESRNPTLEAV